MNIDDQRTHTYKGYTLVDITSTGVTKFSKEQELARKALEDEFNALINKETGYDYKGQLGADAECVQCDWRGTVDDLFYEDEFADGTCPECKEPVEFLIKE